MRRNTLILATVLTALWVCRSNVANAFERQWHVGANGGWSAVSYKNNVYGGWGGGAHLVYGLTDSFNLMVDVGASSHAIYADRPRLTVMSGAAGAAYTLDVLRWVPYFGLLVGGYSFGGAALPKPDYKLGFQTVFGIDYALNRSWTLGAQVRYHTFSDDPFSAHYLSSYGRISYVWGW